MYKQHNYIKYIKKVINRLNVFFENFFSKIDFKNLKKISLKNIKDNNSIFFFILLFTLILIYFLFPTFYDKQEIKSLLAKKIIKKYSINLIISDDITYGIFPLPHFKDYNSKISFKENIIAEPEELKIFISFSGKGSESVLALRIFLLIKFSSSVMLILENSEGSDLLIFFVPSLRLITLVAFPVITGSGIGKNSVS